MILLVRLLFLLQSYLNPGGSEFYSFLIYDSDKGFWEGAGKATARFGHYGLIGPGGFWFGLTLTLPKCGWVRVMLNMGC